MRIIARETLRAFWETHPDAQQPLRAWFKVTEAADWASPSDIKTIYPQASILRDNRVCFDIGGNKYRLIVKVNYPYRVVYIRFVGTHREYDRIDANKI